MFTTSSTPRFDNDDNDSVRDLLVRGLAAAKGNSKEEARFYLEWVTRSADAQEDQLIEACRALAEISDDPKEKRNWLEQVLSYNPSDPAARRALALLNGEIKPEEIIDPNRVSAPASTQPLQMRRFVCPNCAGKMAFTLDGNALTCEYCGHRQSLMDALDNGVMVEEQNFAVALATAKGHTTPKTVRSIKCHGCGASFVFSPEMLSGKCPYCGSAYAVEQAETRALIEPEAIVPFAITQDQALKTEVNWFRGKGLRLRAEPAPPSGIYLPAWTFDVGGELKYSYQVYENKKLIQKTGSWVVFENDLIVPASHNLSGVLLEEITHFILDGIKPYDIGYLANWLAETYEISVSDASLVARSRVFEKEKREINKGIFGQLMEMKVSSANLAVNSFKLILLPMWVTYYQMEGKKRWIVINGWDGNLRAEEPHKGASGWLSSLLGES